MRTTKIEQVKNHLLTKGKINTWEAYENYGVTRLSSIIHTFRNNGFYIESKPLTKKDRNGNTCNYVDYILINDESLLS
jgi:hypothetical protein